MSLFLNYSQISVAPPYKIVDWATGTDEEVAGMIQAAHDGKIKLADYWKVGDTRTVHLTTQVSTLADTPSPPVTDFGISDQNVELVLAHKPTSNSFYGNGEFIIHQKNCLNEKHKMNESNTNTNSFEGSGMYNFLNYSGTINNVTAINTYLLKLPLWLSSVLLDAKVISGIYNGNTTGGANQVTTCKIFLPAEKEVFGSKTYSTNNEANSLEQWDWFKTTANRVKNVSGSAYPYWLRSPYYSNSGIFCDVTSAGTTDNSYASNSYGVAPCMLI